MPNIEVFIAGCPCCDEAVKTVKETACERCEVTIHDLREEFATSDSREKAKQYGINKVPAVVIDGKLSDCCQHGPVSADSLRAAGVGRGR